MTFGQFDGEAVEQDRVMLLDLSLRDRGSHLGDRSRLKPGELREVRLGAGGMDVEPMGARGG